MSLSAHVITKNGAAILPQEATAAVRALPWSGAFLGFLSVPKKPKVTAAGGAVNFRFSSYRVAETLV